MKIIRCSALLFAFTLGHIATAHADDRGRHERGWRAAPCQSSAVSLYKACTFDIRDDLSTLEAACDHIADYDERRSCQAQASEELTEGREECMAQVQSRFEVCGLLDEWRYADPIADLTVDYIDPNDVPSIYPANPYVSVEAGRTLLLRGGSEEFEERVVIHVTDEVREILGVPCRIVWDIVFEAEENEEGEVEYEPVEVTQDWFAQSAAGDVYYCGEAVQDYEDGLVVSLDGAFEAGTDYAKGGLLTQASPVIGLAHRQEMYVGEAEDLVQYLELAAIPTEEEGGDNPSVPCAPSGCLKTFDFSTLDPASTEYKYYLAGTGFVLAVGLEDGELTGEREELVCAGDSLSVLGEPQCQLDEFEAISELLCELVPGVFCED